MTSTRAARRRKLADVAAMLRPHAVGEGRAMVLGALFAVATVTLQVLRPWPLKWIVDFLSGASGQPAFLSWVSDAPLAGIVSLSALFVTLAFAGAGAEYAQVMVLNGLGNRVLYRFRAALFANVLRQPLGFHESREIGELLTRVVYDTSRLRRGLNGALVRLLQTLALCAAVLAVLLWMHLALGLVMAAGGALALVTMQRRGRRIARAAARQRRKEGKLASLVGNDLRSIRELHAFGMSGSDVQERFANRNDKSLRQEQKARRLAAGLVLRIEVLLAATIALALVFGAQGVLSGRLTPGDLVLFLSYALVLRAPLADFATQTARLGRAYACAERLSRIDKRTPAIADAPDAVPAPPIRGQIRFDGVTVKARRRVRGARKLTLNRLSSEVPAGKRIAVVGGNGAGKSTLLRLMLRLVDPDRGQVIVDGHDLRNFTIDSVRAQVSVVFQDTVLAGLSVRDNIALGIPGADDDAIQSVASAAQIHTFIERLPMGYETPVRRGGELFSGGERQRLAIARALLRDGAVWLLDEPTSALDPATADDLTDVLFGATSGRTTLWVTHDPSLVRRMDWVLELDRGVLQFAGSPDEFAARRGPAHDPAPAFSGER
jgi:ATP-binding cassette subfamily B protein